MADNASTLRAVRTNLVEVLVEARRNELLGRPYDVRLVELVENQIALIDANIIEEPLAVVPSPEKRQKKAEEAEKKEEPKPEESRSSWRCAIAGCPAPKRVVGYCLNHYQKRKRLEKQEKLPKDWVENAKPGTVADIKLPRGRAAKKAA